MATYTENYNLEKPAQSDLYNIDVFNENADKIDEALGDKAENQSLAPIESSSTASRNYSIGQQFVYNGLLYEATSAIASGGTITPGSNCARTTVAEELSALNDSFANLISTGTATTNTSVCTGTCKWTKIGRILFISIEDLAITTQISDNTTALFSNLPTASVKVFLAQQYNTGAIKRFAFVSQKITAWYDTLPVSAFQYYALIAVI